MRKALWFFTIILGVLAVSSESTYAQSAAVGGQPGWDINASAGFFQGRPTDDTRGWDDWYSEGRYAASIGRYWTTHFKTEVEFATTGEGRRFTHHYVPVPGTAINHVVSVEEFHRVQQTSARAVWQFNDNAWVHPYVNAGLVYDVERKRQWVPEQFYYPPGDPRTTPRLPLEDLGIGNETATDHRVGFTIGGGARFYFSPRAYINTGMQITRAKPSTTISFLAGLGIDF
jgi:opacity protein-like surface antigen